jgi:hypothetical protein
MFSDIYDDTHPSIYSDVSCDMHTVFELAIGTRFHELAVGRVRRTGGDTKSRDI